MQSATVVLHFAVLQNARVRTLLVLGVAAADLQRSTTAKHRRCERLVQIDHQDAGTKYRRRNDCAFNDKNRGGTHKKPLPGSLLELLPR